MNLRSFAILLAGGSCLTLSMSEAQDPPKPPRPATSPKASAVPKPPRTPKPSEYPMPPGARWELFDMMPPSPFFKDEMWPHADALRQVEKEARVHFEWSKEDALRAGEEARMQAELQRERWQEQVEVQKDLWRLQVEEQKKVAMTHMLPHGKWAEWDTPMAFPLPRAPWAPNDQGDSVYRQARELLNQGEYRRAAAAFRDITTKTPTSAYAADALYYQAFALYRMGGSEELRSALAALETQRTKYPGARMQAETAALAMRINGALAARGDAQAAAQVRTAAGDSALQCDREEQAVRVEALNALTQSDIEGAMPVLQRILGRKDECSVMLRRNAVFLIGSKRRDGSAVPILAQAAKTDPSIEVRGSAMEWLARVPGEDALSTLEELSRDDDERVQRSAVRALVQHPSVRARTLVRGIVERSETPERLRLEALAAFDKERSTSDDVTWMRTLYGRTENPKIKARIVSTLSNIGGTEVDQWMLTVARNADEASETRRWALRRVGKTLPIADLARLYDASAERPIRESLIETLASRAEAEATDKLIDIVKTGTDPQLRRAAISALTRKKDPRTMRLLMEIIDK